MFPPKQFVAANQVGCKGSSHFRSSSRLSVCSLDSLTARELDFNFDRMSCLRIFVNELHSLEWLGILLARVAVGLLFFLSGCGKLFVAERREQMHRTLIEAHIPFPDLNALLVSTVEFVCGLLLVLGAVTPLVCVLLAFVMVLAIATIAIRNIKASSPAEWLAAFLYLPEPLYLVILIWLLFSGPGWLSIDQLFLSRTRL